jgi:hypothetical protein
MVLMAKLNLTFITHMGVHISDEGLNQTSFSAWEKITDDVPQGSVF